MQVEYNNCKSEFKNAKKEVADLKVQIHDYIAKVRAAEEALQEKVENCLNICLNSLNASVFIIKQYRRLC